MSTFKELESLINHEIAYFSFGANVQITDDYIALYNEQLPEFRDCNRLIKLRDTGLGPEKSVDLYLKWFQQWGRRVVLDVDYVAEEQRLGAVLRSRGVLPVVDNFVCLRLSGSCSTIKSNSETIVVELDKSSPFLTDWVWLNGTDESNELDAEFWRRVALMEAKHPGCKLLLAFLNERPVGACSIFSYEGWGRVDSVIVHPDFRRIGVGAALIMEAVRVSMLQGNAFTYLYTQMNSAGHSLYCSMGFTEWFVNPFRRHFGTLIG